MIELIYLLASVLFILGLKFLGSPRSAPRGNLLASVGMFIAASATIWHSGSTNQALLVIVGGIVVGAVIGAIAAKKVQMTAMPQMVALFNGLGGAASALVVGSELLTLTRSLERLAGTVLVLAIPRDGLWVTLLAASLSTLIGMVTFTGSLVAFGKLQGWVTSKPVQFPLQKLLNLALFLAALGCVLWATWGNFSLAPFICIAALGTILGITSVIPIGGADMPVVISLLNSYSGLAASAAGFVLQNNALIIGGALVGASGVILTQIMCKAMNRSLANVLFGGLGQDVAGAGGEGAAGGGTVKSGSPEEAAMMLDMAQLVIVVPGYGMAVAQAQHAVREMANLLEKNGTEVKYAIHPVAGRMPGHMNVLLAEADVPYEQLLDRDEVNPLFSQADVAMVIGANDVTNPAARTDTSSPIYGMPILDVDKARSVMVLKRSMKPGFAGVDNELYTRDNTMMVFGDAKKTVQEIVSALKEL